MTGTEGHPRWGYEHGPHRSLAITGPAGALQFLVKDNPGDFFMGAERYGQASTPTGKLRVHSVPWAPRCVCEGFRICKIHGVLAAHNEKQWKPLQTIGQSRKPIATPLENQRTQLQKHWKLILNNCQTWDNWVRTIARPSKKQFESLQTIEQSLQIIPEQSKILSNQQLPMIGKSARTIAIPLKKQWKTFWPSKRIENHCETIGISMLAIENHW